MAQQADATNKLLEVQELLGGLGFTLMPDFSFSKEYATTDGAIIRLVPVFDRGVSIDMSYDLIGFNITTSRFVAASDSKPNNLDGPNDMRHDVSVITNALFRTTPSMPESFMVTSVCSVCNEESNSFIRQGDVETCLKCMGYTGK